MVFTFIQPFREESWINYSLDLLEDLMMQDRLNIQPNHRLLLHELLSFHYSFSNECWYQTRLEVCRLIYVNISLQKIRHLNLLCQLRLNLHQMKWAFQWKYYDHSQLLNEELFLNLGLWGSSSHQNESKVQERQYYQRLLLPSNKFLLKG